MKLALIYVTAPDLETATRLGRKMVEERLAACINIIPKMVSLYRWKGKFEQSEEVVMIVKTEATRFKEVETWIKSQHPYECPCVLRLDVVEGNAEYLDWISASLKE